jgi:hypothetical protein
VDARQLTAHVTLVHRLDAGLAVGRAVGLAPDLAAGCVSDLLDMFSILPRIDDFPALAELRGAALDLLLVLSRRAALDGSRVEASGDPRLLAHWLEHSRLEPA